MARSQHLLMARQLELKLDQTTFRVPSLPTIGGSIWILCEPSPMVLPFFVFSSS
jgi:hypothetical protein